MSCVGLLRRLMVQLRGWVTHCAGEGPQKQRSARMCLWLCMCLCEVFLFPV